MKKTLTIPNISCGHCVKSVERELGLVDGVDFVQGNQETKAILVEYNNEQALDNARTALGEAGYAPSN